MRGKRITRQWKKAFGSELPEAAPGPEEASTDLWAHLPEFLDSVEEVYNQLDEKATLAQRSLELSSAELTEANNALFNLNQSFDALLNSLGQGFLLLGKDGFGQTIWSRACESLLETNPEGKPLAEILKVPVEKREAFNEWYSLLFQELLDFDDMVPLGPKTFAHSQGRVIQLDFKPVRNPAGAIDYVLLIATDLTKEVQATEKAKEVQAYANFISSILRNRSRFAAYVKEFRQLIKECAEITARPVTAEAYSDLKNILHGLKGASGTFGLLQVEKRLHSAESAVVTMQSEGESLGALTAEIVETSSIFENILRQNQEILAEVLPKDGPQRQVSLARLNAFEAELARSGNADLRRRFLEEFVAEPVFSILRGFRADLQGVAERVGKQIDDVYLEGEDFRIVRERYAPVLADMVHLFRNIADHGIEAPEARKAAGKPVAGRVRITCARKGKELEIVIADDGAGIDEARLAEKLARKGISYASRPELLDSIFRADVSTAGTVSEISGRGVGLFALRSSVENLGGSISVSSERGRGTVFTLRLPDAGLE